MSLIVQRLKEYIEFKGIAVSIAEKKAGLSNGSLSKPFKVNTAIKTDTLEKFLNKYSEINPVWLLTGNGSMIKSDVIPNVLGLDPKDKELADARLDVIEGLKFKIATLEEKISELRYTKSETFLHANVAGPAPELIGKKRK